MFYNTKVKLLIVFMLGVVACCGSSYVGSSNAYAANFPLEITNIKPAGSGNPAIPATNRIFRAYPGIEYNIRPAVIGGLYPFTFSLSNAPAGMTINSSTGVISWPNPQSNSGTITLTVTDAEGTSKTTTWAITVSTSGFKFINASYTGTKTGSITQPFSTIAELQATSGAYTDIAYFREGTYAIPGNGELYLTKAHNWIGYPGETVTITGSTGAYLRSDAAVYIDNMIFSNFTNYTLMLWGGHNYQTIRRCAFSNLVSNSSINNNFGFIYATGTGGSSFGYYTTIQDNDLSYYTGASAIGSLYSMNKMLIENNYIHDNGGDGLPGYNPGISPKEWINNLSIRGNRIILKDNFPFGNPAFNSTMVESSGIDVSFNFFNRINTSSRALTAQYNVFNSTKNFYYYRNTVVGGIGFSMLDGNTCGISNGPWVFSNNVMIDLNTTFGENTAVNSFYFYTGNSINNPYKCITDTNNLKGLPSANIIDANGNLTTAYKSFVGSRGWQTGASTLQKITSYTACDDAGKCKTFNCDETGKCIPVISQ